MVAVRLADNDSGEILWINVFEWLVILAGSKMYGEKEFDARESEKYLVGLWPLGSIS